MEDGGGVSKGNFEQYPLSVKLRLIVAYLSSMEHPQQHTGDVRWVASILVEVLRFPE